MDILLLAIFCTSSLDIVNKTVIVLCMYVLLCPVEVQMDRAGRVESEGRPRWFVLVFRQCTTKILW